MRLFALLFVFTGCSSTSTTGTACPAGFQDAGDGSCRPVAVQPVATDGQGGGGSPTTGGTGTGGTGTGGTGTGGTGTGGGTDDIIGLCIAYVEALDVCLIEAFDTTLGTDPDESCAVFEGMTGTDASHNIDALTCFLAVLGDADCSSVDGYEAMVQGLTMDCPPLVIETPYDSGSYDSAPYDGYGDSGW